MGFVVDKVSPGKVFFEYFGVPCHFAFHRLLRTHHISPVAGATGQLLADLPSALSLTPPQKKRKEYLKEVSVFTMDHEELRFESPKRLQPS
jgi:hypothetical protein